MSNVGEGSKEYKLCNEYIFSVHFEYSAKYRNTHHLWLPSENADLYSVVDQLKSFLLWQEKHKYTDDFLYLFAHKLQILALKRKKRKHSKLNVFYYKYYFIISKYSHPKAMLKGMRRSLIAGMLAPPVSGIHHCLQKHSSIFASFIQHK